MYHRTYIVVTTTIHWLEFEKSFEKNIYFYLTTCKNRICPHHFYPYDKLLEFSLYSMFAYTDTQTLRWFSFCCCCMFVRSHNRRRQSEKLTKGQRMTSARFYFRFIHSFLNCPLPFYNEILRVF